VRVRVRVRVRVCVYVNQGRANALDQRDCIAT